MNLCAGPSLHIYSRYVTAESNTWFMVAVVALTNNSADAGAVLACPAHAIFVTWRTWLG